MTTDASAKPEIGGKLEFSLVTRSKGSIFAQLESLTSQLEDNLELDLATSNIGIMSIESELKQLFLDLERLEVHQALAEASEKPFYDEAGDIIQSEVRLLQDKIKECSISGAIGMMNENFKVDKIEVGDGSDLYQYYQSPNARMFLHPINNRCLIEHFQELAHQEAL